MNNTALRAEAQSANNTHMVFANEEHEKFYYEKLEQARYQDCYHKALIYILGISEDTRYHFSQIYDMKSGFIKPECLHQGWQTSGSVRVVRLAFNLYTDGTPSVDDYKRKDEQIRECREYSVSDIFCCGYAMYFWQGIKLRYPEYCQSRSPLRRSLQKWRRNVLKIRLMGTKNDIKWFEKILKRQPKVAVTEVSELYRNKGTNRYYRAYVEVQKANIKEKSN